MSPARDSSSEELSLSSSSSAESASASASDSTRSITGLGAAGLAAGLAAEEAGCEISARQDAEPRKLLYLRGGLACVAGFLRGGLWPAAAAALSAAAGAAGFFFARDGCARFACAFAAARGGSARFAGALAAGFFFFFPACHRRAGGARACSSAPRFTQYFGPPYPGQRFKAEPRASVVPRWDWRLATPAPALNSPAYTPKCACGWWAGQ